MLPIARIMPWLPSREMVSRHLALGALLVVASMLTPDPAFAQSAGNGLNALAQNVLAILQNGFVRTIAVIAVIIVGIGWLTGRINFSTLIAVVVGIFIIFSAPWIVDQITGGAGG